MLSQNLLKQLEKIAKPGITIHYTELNNHTDKTTITDIKGELADAIKKNKYIGEIVVAIYKNTSFKGSIGVEPNGKIHIVDSNKLIHQFKVTKTTSALKIYDPVNNKTTIIEHTISKVDKVVKKSLQEQILEALKKKKMTDKEVLEYLKNLTKK